MKMIVEENGITPENYVYRVVVNTHLGVRNGYVGVPETSKLFGLSYTYDEDAGEKYEDAIDYKTSVHGGLTYSGNLGHNIIGGENFWYFGFDCGHYNDAKIPIDEMVEVLRASDIPKSEYKPIMDRYSMLTKLSPDFAATQPRSFQYVKKHCLNLSKQLKEIENVND